MASKKYLSVSRSVACSLAALLVLSGAMFLVTTFQSDSEEWVLVEDEVVEFGYLSSTYELVDGDSAEAVAAFDEDTSTYTVSVTGGSKASATTFNCIHFVCLDNFDFSEKYKFVVSSDNSLYKFAYYMSHSNYTNVFNLANIESDDDGRYTAEIVIYDQLVTDLSYQTDFYMSTFTTNSSTFADDEFTMQVYTLESDNTGSVAAGVTGLLMIIFGIFAMPSVNILRRR